MKEMALVALGGALGSVARFKLSGLVLHHTIDWRFPAGTFAVNVLGCLVAGLLAGLAEEHDLISPAARLLLFTGLLGGFTTFSAFGLETMFLIRRGEVAIAAANIGLSVALGLVALWIGLAVIPSRTLRLGMRLLLVEDVAMIGTAAQQGLRQEGHAVDWVRDGREAELAVGNGVYDLVLLDLGLPRKDGLSVLRSMRAHGHKVPVLIITARDAVSDRVAGLDAGADDYLVKPFDLDELAARVRAVLRRRSGRSSAVIHAGDLEIDTAARQVRWKGRDVALSAREYALLEALADRPGAFLSRSQLEERLYGWEEEIASNAVEVHVHALRRKLDPSIIRNVRGMGYSLVKDA